MKRDRDDTAADRRALLAAAAERRAAAVANGEGASAPLPPPPPPARPPPSPPSTVILVSSQDTSSADGGGDADRARAQAGRGAGPSHNPHTPRFDPLARTGFALTAVDGLAPRWNAGTLGLRLRDLAPSSPPPSLVWASNFGLSPAWMLRNLPAVRAVTHRLIVCVGDCAGRRGGDAGDADLLRAQLREVQAAFASGCPALRPNADDAISVGQPALEHYGTHHTKALFLVWPGLGCRFICVTGNFVEGEYCDAGMTQAAWWQDFPVRDGDSPPRGAAGGFEEGFSSYVSALARRGGLGPGAAADLQAAIAAHDWSSARAHFVGSVPGSHKGADAVKWGHGRLGRILCANAGLDPALVGASSIIAQCSSLGSMAAPTLDGFDAALRGGCAAGGAALGHPPVPLRIVWPTNENIRNSLNGWASGGSVPSMAKYTRAPGLSRRLCVWGGEPVGRSRAIAHMKSLARVSDDGRAAWVVLGSHNFSCAAWGSMPKPTKSAAAAATLGTAAPDPPPPPSLYIRSFEVSVALTPRLEAEYRAHRHRGFCAVRPPPGSSLLAGADECPPPEASPPVVHFWAGHRAPGRKACDGPGAPQVVALPLPYDIPPTRYSDGDVAWASDSPPLGVQDVFGREFGVGEGA